MRNETVTSSASNGAALSETEELLDEAIADLGERDRNAVLLRFFAGRSLREVGEVMGVSEDAAKNRISRAVERLRAISDRRASRPNRRRSRHRWGLP